MADRRASSHGDLDRDGGAFATEYLWLCQATDGRVTALELFEPEDLDAALTRFEELRSAHSEPTPSG